MRTRALCRALPFLLAAAFDAAARAGDEPAPGASEPPVGAHGEAPEPEGSLEEAGTGTPAADDAKVRQARNYFRSGVQLYQEGNYDGALAQFARAYQLVPNYRILYNLAQTHAERHDYVEASSLLGEYLAEGGEEIPAARREAVERERLALVARIATVQLESNVEGAELFIAGESRGVIARSHSLQLNPGISELRLQKRGYEPARYQLTLAGGDSPVLDLTLRPVTDRTEVALASAGDPSRTGLWVSVAATTALGAATATFAVLMARADDELDDELRRFPANAGDIDVAGARLRTYAALTDGFAAATVIGAGVVIYSLVSGAGASPAVGASSESASAKRLVLTRDGLAVAGAF